MDIEQINSDYAYRVLYCISTIVTCRIILVSLVDLQFCIDITGKVSYPLESGDSPRTSYLPCAFGAVTVP